MTCRVVCCSCLKVLLVNEEYPDEMIFTTCSECQVIYYPIYGVYELSFGVKFFKGYTMNIVKAKDMKLKFEKKKGVCSDPKWKIGIRKYTENNSQGIEIGDES